MPAFRDQSDQRVLTESQRQERPELAWVDGLTDLLDTKFVIPGTQIRFGADFLMGLFPGVGDTISMLFSGVMVATMAKNGASGFLVARMMLNVALDAVFGTVPVLGNLFDLFYKANHRNMKMMREHYEQGKHQGSAWPVIAGVIVVMGLLLAGIVAVTFTLVSWIASLFA